MQTHKMQVIIPKDHRLTVEVPEEIRSGPAELVFIVPSEESESASQKKASPEALARWDSVMAEIAKDQRPFRELSREEKRARHRLLRGVGKGLLPSSEEFARAKRREVELEDRKFGR